MKKLIFLSVLLFSICAKSQITDTLILRNYINANIVPNSTQSITATKLSTTLHGLLNVLQRYKADSIYVRNDSLFQKRFASEIFIKKVSYYTVGYGLLGSLEVDTNAISTRAWGKHGLDSLSALTLLKDGSLQSGSFTLNGSVAIGNISSVPTTYVPAFHNLMLVMDSTDPVNNSKTPFAIYATSGLTSPRASYSMIGMMSRTFIKSTNNQDWPEIGFNHPGIKSFSAILGAETGASGNIDKVATFYGTITGIPTVNYVEADLIDITFAGATNAHRRVGISIADVNGVNNNTYIYFKIGDSKNPRDGSWGIYDSVGFWNQLKNLMGDTLAYNSYLSIAGTSLIANSTGVGLGTAPVSGYKLYANGSGTFANFSSTLIAPTIGLNVAVENTTGTTLSRAIIAHSKLANTAASFNGTNAGTISRAEIGSTNTQDWTLTSNGGLVGVWGQNFITTGATGTLSKSVIFLAQSSYGAMTVSNHYGLISQNPGSSGTVTNAAGIAVENITRGTNNTLLLLGTTTIPSGSANGIYISGSFANNLGTGLTEVGSFKTSAPSGGTAATWKFGTVASVSPTSPNRTIEVEIGGVTYYISAKTTND